MTLKERLQEITAAGDDHLYILWTNADVTASKLMVFMYAENAMKQHWWDKVTVIVWGATTKLAAENEEIQAAIRKMQAVGVDFTACITCAKELGVESAMEELGVELIKWGPPMTALIKGKKHLLSV